MPRPPHPAFFPLTSDKSWARRPGNEARTYLYVLGTGLINCAPSYNCHWLVSSSSQYSDHGLSVHSLSSEVTFETAPVSLGPSLSLLHVCDKVYVLVILPDQNVYNYSKRIVREAVPYLARSTIAAIISRSFVILMLVCWA